MNELKQPEVWLRGPLHGIPALLQPVAHALLQADEEVKAFMIDFPEDKLWNKIAGMASAGFHLQHLTGVLDRLFTYAKGESLNKDQLSYLTSEGKNNGMNSGQLVSAFTTQINKSIAQLSQTNEQILTEARTVGRTQIPSTVIGLLVHSAEHTMRHTGQLLVTVSILKNFER